MRFLIAVILIGGLAYAGYHFYSEHQAKVEALEQENEALRAQLADDTPAAQKQRVVCPQCKGEGRLMARRPNKRDIAYPCPVCHGQGIREADMPPGSKLCPDCKGMAMIPVSRKRLADGKTEGETERIVATRCMRCNGSGYVRSPK